MADITAGTFASSVPQRIRLCRQSLTAELAARGAPPIPTKMVRAHKREAIRVVRPGTLRFSAPAIRLTKNVLAMLSVSEFIEDYCDLKFGWDIPEWADGLLHLVCWLGAAAGVVMIVATFFYPGLWPLILLAVPTASFFALDGIDTWVSQDRERQVAIAAQWQRYKANEFSHWREARRMPGRIADRAETARTIPGVDVEIETLYLDPLIRAKRGWWIFSQRAYIGAWETGNPELDDV